MVDRVTHMINIQSTALDVFVKKNADYGDAFAKYGIIGVLIRIQDKIQRALTITTNNIHLTEDESITDTMLDLHNYAAMALMLMEEGKAERYIATETDNTSQSIDFTDSEECGEEFESDIGNKSQYYYENQLNSIEYDDNDDYGLCV